MSAPTITETLANDVAVGATVQWNNDRTSTVTSIAPEGRAFLRFHHRSNQARPDGKHNTFSWRVRRDSYVPVVGA
jgi:hypothetical protein